MQSSVSWDFVGTKRFSAYNYPGLLSVLPHQTYNDSWFLSGLETGTCNYPESLSMSGGGRPVSGTRRRSSSRG